MISPDLFKADRSWLALQPKMDPWEEGHAMLTEQMTTWLAEYSLPLCAAAVTARHPDCGSYVQRLWGCWSHHWRSAAQAAPAGRIDGWEVAERIRSGRGYDGKGRLGGDPLRDVVLAEAVRRHEDKATRCFEAEYYDYAVRQAGRVAPAFAACPDWWNDWMDLLAGYSRPPGKLASFAGKCGLQNWLGTVVKNFVRGLPPPAGGPAGLDAEAGTELAPADQDGSYARAFPPGGPTGLGQSGGPDQEVISEECLRLFRELIAEALAGLKAEDRLLLLLLFVQDLQGKEAARILRIDPGNVSRRKERALDGLRDILEQREAGSRERPQKYRDCLQHLLATRADRSSFGRLLFDALQEVSREGAHP